MERIFEIASCGNMQDIKSLWKQGNYADKDGMTVLMYAACFNPNDDVCGKIIDCGGDLFARDIKGRTAAMYAAMHNSNPEIFLNLNNLTIDDLGELQIKYIIKCDDTSKLINNTDLKGNTELMYAVMYNWYPQMISTIMNMKNIDLYKRNYYGMNAFDLAFFGYYYNPHYQALKTLLENGYDLSTLNKFERSLICNLMDNENYKNRLVPSKRFHLALKYGFDKDDIYKDREFINNNDPFDFSVSNFQEYFFKGVEKGEITDNLFSSS